MTHSQKRQFELFYLKAKSLTKVGEEALSKVPEMNKGVVRMEGDTPCTPLWSAVGAVEGNTEAIFKLIYLVEVQEARICSSKDYSPEFCDEMNLEVELKVRELSKRLDERFSSLHYSILELNETLAEEGTDLFGRSKGDPMWGMDLRGANWR